MSKIDQILQNQEAERTNEAISFNDFQEMLNKYELSGDSPEIRLDALRSQSKENIALFITDLDRGLRGAESTMIHNQTMKIGEKGTVSPEDRYQIFSNVIEKIHNSPQGINPARVGDALALATVILHPFSDGNGRTARAIGLVYRPEFDNEGQEDFDQLVESRDKIREGGGFMINGYVPYSEGENLNQTDAINAYIDDILGDSINELYTGPYGQASLYDEEKVMATS